MMLLGRRSRTATEGEQKGMLKIPVRACFRALAATVLGAVVIFSAATAARAQAVVVLVDGVPITALDIDHRAKFMEMSNHKVPSRQEAIDSLIDEILELREAKRFGLEPSDSDVTAAFDSIASNMGVDEQKFTQILISGGASADTLKQRLRAQIVWGSLVRGRFQASLQIPDSDVEAQLQLHKTDDTSQVGYEYVLRPIILVVPHGSADAAYQARKKDAEALRVRFQNCSDGISFARGLPETAVRDPVNKSSADLAQALRDILDRTDIGHLTPPEQTSEGIQMFAVCSKKESKTDAPALKELRDQMFEHKFDAKAARYLANIRRQAMIEYKNADIDQSKSPPKGKTRAN
jgi:peptidyl-prolyl cis-trans isomerase SurA